MGAYQKPLYRVIQYPSIRSLHLRMAFGDNEFGNATGFVVKTKFGPFLLTNRHVVTGRHHDTNEPLDKVHAAVPDNLRISHHSGTTLGKWVTRSEPLFDSDGKPLWIEHPKLGEKGDFVALPLTELGEVMLYPYDTSPPTRSLRLKPAQSVSVVGFPFGASCDGFAIWATGFIATELVIDYENRPVFLVDCRTRSGQSGSPVVAFRTGSIDYTDGHDFGGKDVVELLGIYSGRLHEKSDIGLVWKISAIHELIESINQEVPSDLLEFPPESFDDTLLTPGSIP